MRQTTIIASLLLTAVMLVIANILWGDISIPFSDSISILFGHSSEEHPWHVIIWEHRIPQAITAALCGASLATCGLLLQTTFRNPLAGPSILGIDSGANLGVAIVMLLLGGSVTLGKLTLSGHLLVIMAAMVGAWLILLILLAFSRKIGSHVMLLITGIMVSYITGSIISLLNFRATEQGVHAYMMWGMGNFSGISMQQIPLFSLLCLSGLFCAILHTKALNALLLGEQYASNLGYNIKSVRTRLLLITGLLTATTTAFCGPITFLGLAVPHLAQLLISTHNHRNLLPTTMLTGAILALVCNIASTFIIKDSIVPINVITPCFGGPIVIWIIMKRR